MDSSTTTPRPRHGRTVRTVTCDLPALTGPMLPNGIDRMLAGPEVVIKLPRFEGHMLSAPLTLRTSPTPILAIPEPEAHPPIASRPPTAWWRQLIQRAGLRRRARAS